jgi:hypothetical protein
MIVIEYWLMDIMDYDEKDKLKYIKVIFIELS